MGKGERGAAYASMGVLALTFGWIEASVVVYLREIYFAEGARLPAGSHASLEVTLVSLPSHLVRLEMMREACTLILLVAAAWLAGRRLADRAGGFLVTFGLWDLTHYVVLWLISGWPASLSAWDVLFLIPLPWVAPVWAPTTVAVVLVAAGSYLFWTPGRRRTYRRRDAAILTASGCLIIAAFLSEWRAVADHRVPEQFSVWLFWAGVILGTAWFARVEQRPVDRGERTPWVDERVGPLLEALPGARQESTDSGAPRSPSGERPEPDSERVFSDYGLARRRVDDLREEAHRIGERLQRLAHGLTAHPTRMIIGPSDQLIETTGEWDIVPGQSLPSVERLITLTENIREAAREVEELRDRLVLMGRADLVEQPDQFFH